MKPVINKSNIYLTLSLTSFLVLSFQIILSSLLRVYFKVPFWVLSFAFLGLSMAGMFVFLRYAKMSDEKLILKLPGCFSLFAYTTLIYFVFFLRKVLNVEFADLASIPFKDSARHVKLFYKIITSVSLYNGLIFSVIFFFLGLIFSIIYRIYSADARKLYFFDLLGAACGCVGGIILLNSMEFTSIPIFFAFLALSFSFLLKIQLNFSKISKFVTLFFLMFSLFVLILNNETNALKPSFRELWSGWNAYSRVSLVRNPEGSTRFKFLLDNGVGNVLFDSFDPESPYQIELFDDFHAATMGFLNGQPKDILFMFAGSGQDMIEAYSFSRGEANITGIELNPLVVSKALEFENYHLREFFEKENVSMVVQEGRSFLEKTTKRFDSIVYSWAGSPLMNYLGLTGSTAQYLYTVEAFTRCLELLTEDGTLGIVNGNSLRLLLNFKKAFEMLGVDDISRHVIICAPKRMNFIDIFSSKDTSRILVKKTPFNLSEIRTIENNLEKMEYQFVYAPFVLNVNNLEAMHHQAYSSVYDITVSGDINKNVNTLQEMTMANFSLVTDDKPFNENYFLLSMLLNQKFWSLYRNNFPNLEYGAYASHIYKIGFVIVIAVIAIFLLSVFFCLRRKTPSSGERETGYLLYFGLLGFAFMFVEMSLLCRFVLYLGNPVYSFAVIVASILFALGLGSLFSDKFFLEMNLNIRKMSVLTGIMLLLISVVLPYILRNTLGLPLVVKFLITSVLVFPLGFVLGSFFPQGLKVLSLRNSDWVPLAWGLNGYMSVIGSAISVYLSMILGFNALIVISAFLYLMIYLLPLHEG